MRDGATIALGVALFVGFALSPVWQRAASAGQPRPEPKIARPQSACVAPRAVMRVSHMQVLEGWRDAVVRDGARTERTADGRELARSLTGTCLECHSNKQEFCDRCHVQLAVHPGCWSCHPDPKERT
jgi:hypothetical protein